MRPVPAILQQRFHRHFQAGHNRRQPFCDFLLPDFRRAQYISAKQPESANPLRLAIRQPAVNVRAGFPGKYLQPGSEKWDPSAVTSNLDSAQTPRISLILLTP